MSTHLKLLELKRRCHRRYRFYAGVVVALGWLDIPLPAPLRLGFLHFAFTAWYLLLFPPATSLPPILIGLTWAASLCSALTLLSLARLAYASWCRST